MEQRRQLYRGLADGMVREACLPGPKGLYSSQGLKDRSWGEGGGEVFKLQKKEEGDRKKAGLESGGRGKGPR